MIDKISIFNYELSTKQSLPCFRYDLAVYCDCLKQVISVPLPPYLEEFSEQLDAYAKQIKRCRPAIFPEAYRVYLVDYRLNFLFAAYDKTGEIATCFSKYGKLGHKLTDAYYGDGLLIGDVLPTGTYNAEEMIDFMARYGFLPVEELASPAALVYDREYLVERRILSQYQLCLLMEKFRSKNLIDWKCNVLDAQELYPF